MSSLYSFDRSRPTKKRSNGPVARTQNHLSFWCITSHMSRPTSKSSWSLCRSREIRAARRTQTLAGSRREYSRCIQIILASTDSPFPILLMYLYLAISLSNSLKNPHTILLKILHKIRELDAAAAWLHLQPMFELTRGKLHICWSIYSLFSQ